LEKKKEKEDESGTDCGKKQNDLRKGGVDRRSNENGEAGKQMRKYSIRAEKGVKNRRRNTRLQ